MGALGPGHTHPFSISPWRVHFSAPLASTDFFFFFFFLNIYLAVSGLSCDSQDIRSLLQHVGCLVVAYELRVVAWSILVLLTRNRTWAPCTGILESTTEPPGKSQLTSFGLHLYLHNLCSPGSLPLSWELNL